MPREHLSRALVQMRGAWLLLLALPLGPALLFNLIGGTPRSVTGMVLGLGGLALAVRSLRRGKSRQAAALVGVATGLLALMAAHVPAVGAVVFGAMAWFGMSLLYEGAPAPEPEPVPARPDALAAPRARLAALVTRGPARLRPAVFSLQELLAEMERQPEPTPEARRFLNIQIEGLERISTRLSAGAEPPVALETLLEDMTRGSTSLRERLRAQESEALDIQIKVLSDRLRQEGFA
ncbi:hypothetical protein IBL26_12120 [Roseomonas aerophila]|uniref:Uncharacterized protein n=1 Tax=Teichococcus aerophilus TaxID=1224513 RepID=A0ABR7RNA4_9PROT|nr:hypothetical protein [Pseudoroseomonas aerophila]MBC9207582.1 hypothetical protein [Pseudoroseomonas aerophila]